MTALVGRLGEDLAQRRPQAEGTVADGQQRGGQAAIAQIAQDVGSGVRALAVAELHRQELLAAVGAGAWE